MRQLMTESRAHLLEGELNRVSSRAISAEAVVSSALSGVSVATTFPTTGIGRQLQMVARMIAARSALGQRRQMFFVQQGGYDFHDNLLTDQSARLRELGDAMAAFYQATATLGVANQVTTFTASDFGRALQHNGRGSDHGWGGHHFVMGGAVQGNRVYGQFPTVALNGPEDSGRGSLIPTTSVDEYAGTLVWCLFEQLAAGLAQYRAIRFSRLGIHGSLGLSVVAPKPQVLQGGLNFLQQTVASLLTRSIAACCGGPESEWSIRQKRKPQANQSLGAVSWRRGRDSNPRWG